MEYAESFANSESESEVGLVNVWIRRMRNEDELWSVIINVLALRIHSVLGNATSHRTLAPKQPKQACPSRTCNCRVR